MKSKISKTSWIPFAADILLTVLIFGPWVYMLFFGKESLSATGWGSLKFYTVLSNLLLGIVSLIHLPYSFLYMKDPSRKDPKWLCALLLVATVGTTLTFLTVLCFLLPLTSFSAMYSGANISFHLLAPIAGILSFVFLYHGDALPFAYNAYSLSTIAAYVVFYMLNYFFHFVASEDAKGVTYDWYGFAGNGELWRIIGSPILMLAVGFGISCALWGAEKGIAKMLAKPSKE